MKVFPFLVTIIGLTLVVYGFRLIYINKPSANEAGFAVVELFTSEGCSSCPSADKALSTLVESSNDKDIYGLSFHVNYWNHLGWKDPYSSENYTERQRQYAKKLNSNVYTPQMVINGTEQFVGSNKSKADKIIDDNLHSKSKNQINMGEISIDGNQIHSAYKIQGGLDNTVLNVALVERGLKSDVTRGENRGRLLSHDNVVRWFRQMPAESTGEIMLNIPAGVKLENSSIILYTQNKSTLAIQGASKKTLL